MLTLEDNNVTVMAFYDMMFNQSRPRDAIERYKGATYIQHNASVGDGEMVEHWDVLQEIPKHSENDNGLF